MRREIDSLLNAQNRRPRPNFFEPAVWETYGMSEDQFAKTKRTNFRHYAPETFRFLVTEFGYDEPTEEFNAFEDYFLYENKAAGRRVELINQYFSSDYGFDVTIKRIVPNQSITKSENRCTADYVLQTYQDPEQLFLKDSAEKIRRYYPSLLNGQSWSTDWHRPLTNEICKQRYLKRQEKKDMIE